MNKVFMNEENKSIESEISQKNERVENINVCKVVGSIMKTLLGPQSLDKLIVEEDGHVLITNDGATAISSLQLDHPIAKFLVQLSTSMDKEIGDGTTSVVILATSLLSHIIPLITQGFHPHKIIKYLHSIKHHLFELLNSHVFSLDFDPSDSHLLIQTAIISLNSKFVSSSAPHLAKLAVDSIKSKVSIIIKVEGAAISDSRLFRGFLTNSYFLATTKTTLKAPAKIAVLTFAFSQPKTNIKYEVTTLEIDRVLREEETYIKNIVIKLKKLGVTVVVVQEDIMRDAISVTASQWLTKAGIMGIVLPKKEIETLCECIGSVPITGPEQLTEKKEFTVISSVKIQEIGSKTLLAFECDTVNTIVLRGVTMTTLAEAERALNDAMCIIKHLVKKPRVVLGGGVVETSLSVQLEKLAFQHEFQHATVLRAFAEALMEIPKTLAENAGLNGLKIISELKSLHEMAGNKYGIDVTKGRVANMEEANVWESLVSKEAQILMATETAISILKIDQIIQVENYVQ